MEVKRNDRKNNKWEEKKKWEGKKAKDKEQKDQEREKNIIRKLEGKRCAIKGVKNGRKREKKNYRRGKKWLKTRESEERKHSAEK